MKKVFVSSHERSGTHFLINAIGLNFGYDAKLWIDLDEAVPNPYFPNDVINALQVAAQSDKDFVKTHYAAEFVVPVLPVAARFYHIFYIYRESESMMESLCKHLNAIIWNEGPKVKGGKELALAEPSGGMLRYQYRQYPTMKARWEAHVKGWTEDLPEEIKKHIIYIRYEDLDKDFNATISSIAHIFGQLCLTPVRPSKDVQVITEGIYKQ